MVRQIGLNGYFFSQVTDEYVIDRVVILCLFLNVHLAVTPALNE